MIIGSFNKQKIIELYESRQNPCLGYSVSYFNITINGLASFFSTQRNLGELKYDDIVEFDNRYIIISIMEKDVTISRIQPVSKQVWRDNHHEEYSLWHEGYLVDAEIKRLKERENHEDKPTLDSNIGKWLLKNVNSSKMMEWDTELLLLHLVRNGSPIDIHGVLSCIMSDGRLLYMFRNDYGSLFIDQDINVCTQEFNGAVPFPVNRVIRIDFLGKRLIVVADFFTPKIEGDYI